MRKNHFRALILMLFAAFSASLSAGQSAFVSSGEAEIGGIAIQEAPGAVCAIGATKYTTIEKALKVASDSNAAETITVLPGVDYTITRECVLGVNDALIIPYSSANSKTKLTEDVANNGFGDNNPSTYRKCLVRLANKLTISSGALLGICGKTGGTGPQGGTNGEYAELQFLEGGSIDCYGEIKCYGYIHDAIEKSRGVSDIAIHIYEGAVGEPLAMYDWANASGSADKLKYAFPINLFDLPNIRPPMYFEYGTRLVAYGHIYGSNPLVGHQKAEGTIVSKDSEEGFVQLQSGSGVLINFDSGTDLITDSSYLKHSMKLYSTGNVNISDVMVSLQGYKLDSKKFYLPISGIYDLNIEAGYCTVKYNTKFLPGSKLTIGENATVDFRNNVTFYSNKTSDNGSVIPSYNFSGEAQCANRGKMIIGKGLDGKIYSEISNSSIETGMNYSDVQDCNEATGNGSVGPFVFGGGKINLADDETGANAAFRNIQASSKYRSVNTYYYRLNEAVYSVSISPSGQESSEGKSASYDLTATITPSDGISNVEYHWSCDGGDFNGQSSAITHPGETIKYTTPANSGEDNITYTVKCYATFTFDTDGSSGTSLEGEARFVAKASCLSADTMVLMGDGTYKQAIDIRAGDMLMTVNHETGEFEAAPVVFNDDYDRDAAIYHVINLEFSNGSAVKVISEHGFFDLETMRYEYITEANYHSFVGHRFVAVEERGDRYAKETVTLVNAYVTTEKIQLCSPVTYKNLDLIVEGMLSMPGGITGIFNIFEYASNLAYDAEKKQSDIDTYGLFDYSHFEDRIPYEFYEAFNGQYLKVAIGKGILTEAMIDQYINRYLPVVSDQNSGE